MVRYVVKMTGKIPGMSTHRVMFLHLVFLCITLLLDPVFSTVLIVFGSIAMLLIPVTTFFIGVGSGFVFGTVCIVIMVNGKVRFCVNEM